MRNSTIIGGWPGIAVRRTLRRNCSCCSWLLRFHLILIFLSLIERVFLEASEGRMWTAAISSMRWTYDLYVPRKAECALLLSLSNHPYLWKLGYQIDGGLIFQLSLSSSFLSSLSLSELADRANEFSELSWVHLSEGVHMVMVLMSNQSQTLPCFRYLYVFCTTWTKHLCPSKCSQSLF